ncbi:MAG: hypothetical protein Q8M03_15635 [Legionella sp.]|nr:hypothetical protein [Legionella sp.]
MAHSSANIEDVVLHERIDRAIDVSPVMNNCFFHAFALYLLINNEPFPPHLFLQYDQDIKPVQDLKKQFKRLEDLEIFDTYEQLKNPDSKGSMHFFEKTMVLGVFLRSWFAHWLLVNDEYKELLYEKAKKVPVFSRIVEFFNESGAESLSEEALYLANKSFFEEAEEVKPETYWLEQGYSNYCQYLALPGTKIALSDVRPVLDHLGISYAIYGKIDKKIVMESGEAVRKFELAIDPGAGHYFLIVADNNQALDEYKSECINYINERARVLRAHDINKLALCQKKSVLLLAATLPVDNLNGQTAISVLVDKIASIKEFITENQHPELPCENINPVRQPHLLEPDDEVVMPQPVVVVKSSESAAAVVKLERQYARNIFASPPLTRQEVEFDKQLRALKNKSNQFRLKVFKKATYLKAAGEIDTLHQKLSEAFDTYRFSTKTIADYEVFSAACAIAIEDSTERGILQRHRGMGVIIKNFLLAIAGLGVFYFGAGMVNLIKTRGADFLFFKKTDTVKKIDDIKNSIDELENTDYLLE